MTYKELQLTYPDKSFGRVEITRDFEVTKRDRENFENSEVNDLGWNIQLPHQCDEWEIGKVEDAMDLVNELNFAIDYCNLNK